MMTEAVTIGVILAGCAAAAWFAKVKFQPEIDRSLAKIEAAGTIVARSKPSRNA